jgi:hypothetical protein
MFTVKNGSILPSRLENSLFESKQKGKKYPVNSMLKRKPSYQKSKRQSPMKDSLRLVVGPQSMPFTDKGSKNENYRTAIFNTDSFDESDNYEPTPYMTGRINVNTIYGGCD